MRSLHPKRLASTTRTERIGPCLRTVGLTALLALLLVPSGVRAESANELSAEIEELDTQLFTAFNSCDLATMEGLFSEELEFYHDLAGVSNREETMAATRQNCDRKLGLVRELVQEGHEVHPVPDYGAIQKGRHTFCHLENGENVCGTFEFLHVWKRNEDGWKLTRVISYGH